MALELARIEEKIDRVAAGGTEVAMGFGGVKFATLLELMEFSKLMAVSGSAVPVHLRGNPGTCLAVCTKALRYGFDPFSLAEHSYTMSKSMKVDGQWQDVETIAYDSFVIHAIIEAHGDVTGKLKPTYIGEGDDMKCICTGVVNGETLEIETDTVGKIKARIGRNDKGKLKGSPLWESKPKQQLWYDARRDWCRAHQPHILLGWYDKDELQEHADVRDVTPAKPDVASRLKGGKGRGFSANHVERETRGVIDAHSTGYPEGASGTAREAPSAGSGDAEVQSASGTQSAPPPHSNSSQSVSSPDTTETDTPASDPLAPHTATDAGNHSETEAQRGPAAKPLPPAPSGDEPRTSDQEPLSNGSGAADARMDEAAAPTLSNSSQATPQASPTETDKPASAAAADAGNNSGSAAGQDDAADSEARAGGDSSSAGSPSSLAPDWQQTYLTAMSRATDRPKSLLNRHSEAIQLIGGKANSAEQEWMRGVLDLRKRNLEGKLSKADYDAAIREMVDG